ncbi:hypothetical protein CU313_07745 [Prochlorococcus marinus str. MU1404]|uniref:hypothetical protein n=1 Tax=Prochlorococcus marinus TaxID=1219 RepID=UPI001ADCE91A|nr:hypothetical protein [Prochlorococcus marinus]MBO8230721.1 hypothetical protein [Prochlorococcus marinus XMU1404]MBW3073757.1 hypothetical protein [Prochlorococcus marinus str. MU1404]MCR8544947.1 hypothetical protein [Prochlorococcus marinus CUG1432]
MKRFLLPLLAALALPTAVKAEVSSNTSSRKPFILERPCPSEFSSKWECWGFQTMTRLINASAISYCGIENGSLDKEDFWDFAIEHAKNKFPPRSRSQAREDIIEHIQTDRFAVINAAQYRLKLAGGCNNLLKDNYPLLLRESLNNNSQEYNHHQVKKQRPAWMVEKIKGCFKYTNDEQKNYCIKTYSPYGNAIPGNLD